MFEEAELRERILKLRRLRAEKPWLVASATRERTRRDFFAEDGRAVIVAADHPARGIIGIGSDPIAMIDREDLLIRLARVLANPRVDGVLASADILDDLAMLGLLEGRLAIGAINRGGLQGASFEVDDTVTGTTPTRAQQRGLDATKLLLRIDLQDDRMPSVLDRTRQFVDESHDIGLPIVLEPFLCRRDGGRLVNDLSEEAMGKAVAISSGIGSASAYTWLKLPVVPGMETVLRSTTLPVFLLGGDSGPDVDRAFDGWQAALQHDGVRGLMVGRRLTHPADGDIERNTERLLHLVHPSTT